MRKTILCLVYLLLISCHKEEYLKNKFSLEPSNNTVNINIDSDTRNLSPCIQYFTYYDSNYLAILNEDLNTIKVYNLDSRELIKKIESKKEGSNAFPEIMAFIINSLDTIFAVSVRPALIGIINNKGEILKKISFGKDHQGKFYKLTIPWAGQKPILHDNKIFLGQIYGSMESNGILSLEEQKSTNISLSIDLISGESTFYPLTYPRSLIDKDISNMHVCRVLGYNNYFVYNFGLIDSLFVTKDHLRFERFSIKTNYKFNFANRHWEYIKDMKKGLEYDLHHDEVKNIFYDKFRECYYLVVRERENDLDNTADMVVPLQYPHCFIIILDKQFDYMGEVHFPDNTYSFHMVFVGPQGLYISLDHVKNPTFDENYMRFKLFTLKKL
jgi:hypothetical protein